MITELTAESKEWARERALDTANPDKQMLKLSEEFGRTSARDWQRIGRNK